jgi:hypothetical protein
LQCKRKDFVRVGENHSLGWDHITGVKITLETTEQIQNNMIQPFTWSGGSNGTLHGDYKYAQVNVYNSGEGFWKSEMSSTSPSVYVKNGKVILHPAPFSDTQINEVWFYRRDSGVNIDAVPVGTPRRLDKWYRIGVVQFAQGGAAPDYIDNTSDEDALLLNMAWNEELQAVQEIPDQIIAIQTEVFGRVLYATFREIYISDRDDPGLYIESSTIRLSGDPTELNLWIKKPSLGICYVATTKDIYELSGTFNQLEDGTLDIFNKPMGLSRPPICFQVAQDNSAVYYMAADGGRVIQGSTTDLLTKNIDLIFRKDSRHGVGPAVILPNIQTPYPVATRGNKLYLVVYMQDQTRWTLVYDFKLQYWYPYWINPISLYVEEDGILLGGFGDGYLRTLEDGDTLDNVWGQQIVYQTVFDDDNLPRNRKDTFTFKIVADTGNKPVSIAIAKNGQEDGYIEIGSTSFDGKEEKLITIADTVGLGKSFSVRITGNDLRTCRIYHWTIEYDARPEQLTYLKIPYTNLGTISRKRFVNYAFVVDTMGQTCEFTPLIDGAVAGDPSSLIMARKGTYIHFFDSEQIGTDIGGILCGFFEYYGPNLEEIVSEKMPVPTTFLIIPNHDYGVPNRKRHSSYKFMINTQNCLVRFTPKVDGVWQTPMDFSTPEKQIVEYFFTVDTIGMYIGGKLESLEDPKEFFEFYGPIVPQQVEVLPPRLKEFRIPENNYGIAARKRLRTMPMEINTYGYPVTFTPIVDGVSQSPTTIITAHRTTAFHYFLTDMFGIDYSGELTGAYPFEFYGLMKPESVEVLPVGKKFDQLGPLRIDKLAKFQSVRLRVISTGDYSIPMKIISEIDPTWPSSVGAAGEYTVQMPVQPYRDEVYELIMPKTVNGTIFRIELGPTTYPFHRYDLQVKLVVSGEKSDPKWVKVQ